MGGDTWSARDERACAPALPLGAVRDFCRGRRVVVAGHFGHLLPGDLDVSTVFTPGSLAEVVSGTSDGKRRCIVPEALSACLPACDVLLVTDVHWASVVWARPSLLSELTEKVGEGLVMPYERCSDICACRWVEGHSWVESDGEHAWIWANSHRSRISAELHFRRVPGRIFALRFRIIVPEGFSGDFTVEVAGNRCVGSTSSHDLISVPFEADTQIVDVTWTTSIVPVRLAHDQRVLSFGISDMHLVDEDGGLVVGAAELMVAPNSHARADVERRSTLHDAGFTAVHGIVSSSSGFRAERVGVTSLIAPEGLGGRDPDGGEVRPMLMFEKEFGWLFAGKSISAIGARGVIDG